MHEYEVGEVVLVTSDYGKVEDEWLESEVAGYYDGHYLCKGKGVGLVSWAYIKKIPTAPKLVPYTIDTFPKAVVWIKHKNDDAEIAYLVNFVGCHGVDFSSVSRSYNQIKENYMISTDHRQTWQPAGELI